MVSDISKIASFLLSSADDSDISEEDGHGELEQNFLGTKEE